MLSKEEIEKAKEDLRFCNEGDYITKEMSDSKNVLLEYIDKLESKTKKLGKGQQSLMQSRRKWKNRYYKIRKKNKKLESDKQKLIEKLKKRIRYYEENDEMLASRNDNYSDGTVINKFIDEFREILSILKGKNNE